MPAELTQYPPRNKAPFVRAAAFAALSVGTGLLAASGVHYPWFGRFGISEGHADYVMGILAGVLFALALASLLKAKYGPRNGAENHIDEFQNVQRRMLTAITVLVTGFGAISILHALDGFGRIDFSVEFALLAVAAAAITTFGVGFMRRRFRLAANDELVRSLRARGTQIGYMLAMTGLSAAYLLSLFRPGLMAVALPAVLLAGIIAPTLHFLIVERSANG